MQVFGQLKEHLDCFFHLPIGEFSFYQLVIFNNDPAVVLDYLFYYLLFHFVFQPYNQPVNIGRCGCTMIYSATRFT